jgi:hypothetical protein
MARRTFSFAARRLGMIAAATPASPARTITMSSVRYGTLNTVSPWFRCARTSAQPKNTPTTRPRTVPCRAMITDSQRIVLRSWRRVMPTARITRARGSHHGGVAPGGELDRDAVQRAHLGLALPVDLDGVLGPGRRFLLEPGGHHICHGRPPFGRVRRGGAEQAWPRPRHQGCERGAPAGIRGITDARTDFIGWRGLSLPPRGASVPPT